MVRDLEWAKTRLVEVVEAKQGELSHAEFNYLRYASVYAQVSVIDLLMQTGIADHPGSPRVLDLGCGEGLLGFVLAEAGFEVTAVDYYLTGGLATSDVPNLTYVSQNFDETVWDLPADHFDVVISVDVVEHVRAVKNFLVNATRSLAPGGHLILHTPNYGRLTTRLRAAFNVVKPQWPIPFGPFVNDEPFVGHCFEYTPAQLRRLVETVGLDAVQHEFPRAIGWGRVSERYAKASKPLQVLAQGAWQTQEVVRAAVPFLGNSQAILARRPQGASGG